MPFSANYSIGEEGFADFCEWENRVNLGASLSNLELSPGRRTCPASNERALLLGSIELHYMVLRVH